MFTKEEILRSFSPKLAPNAEAIVRKRYMRVNEAGKVMETVSEMFYRVANFMASADAEFGQEDYSDTVLEFYQMLSRLDFLPGGRAFFEAGNQYTGQMASCFVFPLDDSLDSIFQTLKDAAITQKNNGGCGFNFSRIRQKGASVNGVPSVACGPVHYLKTFDAAFSQILQGSKRHGGNMGVLNVDHPDILDFINLKGQDSSIKNFNISVGVSDAFMEAVREDRDWDLIEPHTKQVVRMVSARVLFEKIISKAWECADPGLLFLDPMQKANRNPDLGVMDTTNPCGEQPLLPYESCNLGSFNLENFVTGEQTIDWERLRKCVWSATHFMDNMIQLNTYPIEKIREAVDKTRKIGLGIMGFAHMLYQLGIPYNSEESVALVGKIMQFIQEEGLAASCALAKVRGPFATYETSTFFGTGICPRNSMITSIAPTGTISLFANTTSGIEPQFSLVSLRNTFFEDSGNNTATKALLYVDEIFEAAAKKEGVYSQTLMEKIAEEGTIQHLDEIPDLIKRVFVTAHDIDPLWHVRIQAEAQKYTDAGVSKTINMPHTATIEDVRKVYIKAYEWKCKGITIYRDGSKETQVLRTGLGKTNQASQHEQKTEVPKDREDEAVPVSAATLQKSWRYSDEIPLTVNAMTVLEKRAFLKDALGNVIETPEQLFQRVARTVASAERLYHTTEDTIAALENDFYEMLSRLEFVSGQALRNAGSGEGLTLSACLVLPIQDTIESILQAISENVIAHKATCGTGFNYSHLRPKGSNVENIGPIAAGPVAFMRAVSAAQKTIWTKGGRQQGSMGILNVDHPDIEAFIACKDDLSSFDNMNISVGATDAFMQAVRDGTDYTLIDPHTQTVVSKQDARRIFTMIAEHAWVSGDPGVIFIDKMEKDNPTPILGKLEATNPCGEQPLLPYETCNLGSIVLSRMLRENEDGTYVLDWKKLASRVATAVRFLDNTIDVNEYPFEKIKLMSQKTRRIGLGVMGFADMLILLGIPYNSDEAVRVAEEVMVFINTHAREASIQIASEKGNFPAFDQSVWPSRGYTHMRNSAITTIAPTGYTSIVAGCSSGVEPVFALAFRRVNSMGGQEQCETHAYFQDVAKKRNFFSEELMEKIADTGSIQNISEVPEDVKRLFVVSYDIDTAWDIKIQAAFQKYTDNAVSKTINLPNSATTQDIENIYRMAWEMGCKGVTIYRDGSKEQVLVTGKGKGKETKKQLDAQEAVETSQRLALPLQPLKPRPRPEIVQGSTYKLKTSYGNLFVTINNDEEGRPFEVFAGVGKSGGFFAAKAEAIGRLISLALRSGIPVEDVIKQVKGIRGPMPSWGKNGMIYSIPDAIAQVLEEHVRKPQAQLALEYTSAPFPQDKDKILESQAVVVEKLFPSAPEAKEDVLVGVSASASTSLGGVETSFPPVSHHSIADAGFAPECPDCGDILEFGEGCMMCRACGFSKCG